MLYVSECWALRKTDMARLEKNERAMVRWLCGLKPKDSTSMGAIRTKFKIVDLETTINFFNYFAVRVF